MVGITVNVENFESGPATELRKLKLFYEAIIELQESARLLGDQVNVQQVSFYVSQQQEDGSFAVKLFTGAGTLT